MLSKKNSKDQRPVVHLTPGEIIVPQRVMTPELRSVLDQAFANAGLESARYRVAEEPVNL